MDQFGVGDLEVAVALVWVTPQAIPLQSKLDLLLIGQKLVLPQAQTTAELLKPMERFGCGEMQGVVNLV
jgi:hypothetical protein